MAPTSNSKSSDYSLSYNDIELITHNTSSCHARTQHGDPMGFLRPLSGRQKLESFNTSRDQTDCPNSPSVLRSYCPTTYSENQLHVTSVRTSLRVNNVD